MPNRILLLIVALGNFSHGATTAGIHGQLKEMTDGLSKEEKAGGNSYFRDY